MVKVSQGHLRAWVVALPPLPEQGAIVAFLDHEFDKLDALIARVRNGIEKLKEYRAALISAAVTGKIDVRDAL
jgi:restriction endonuclease S subunit